MWTLGAILVPVDSGAAAPGNQPNPIIIVTTKKISCLTGPAPEVGLR